MTTQNLTEAVKKIEQLVEETTKAPAAGGADMAACAAECLKCAAICDHYASVSTDAACQAACKACADQCRACAAACAPMAKEEVLTKAQFQEYVEAEIVRAVGEVTTNKIDAAKSRLEALKVTVAAAKASFETNATAKIKVFQDPWQIVPTTKEGQVQLQPKAGDSNVQTTADFALVEKADGGLRPTKLLRALVALARSTDATPGRSAVTKSEEGRVLLQKAGEARALLEKIASMFGIQPEPGEDVTDCGLRWKVGDMISALQDAARLENVMSSLGAAMGAATAPVAAAKAAGGEVSWPHDMSSAKYDAADGFHAEVDADRKW